MLNWTLAAIPMAVVAGLGAYFGSYLQTRGQLRAVKETINDIEKRQAEIREISRTVWSKRSEVIAASYGRLRLACREWRYYLRTNVASTPEIIEKCVLASKSFDDYFYENALFLPKHIKQELESIAEQLLKVYARNTTMLPAVNPADDCGEDDKDNRNDHYKQKAADGKRFAPDGDIALSVEKLEDDLRALLNAE